MSRLGFWLLYEEPCPAVLERNDISKGRSNWVFPGCSAMSFDVTLTDPAG